jgi:hypothetical protein
MLTNLQESIQELPRMKYDLKICYLLPINFVSILLKNSKT